MRHDITHAAILCLLLLVISSVIILQTRREVERKDQVGDLTERVLAACGNYRDGDPYKFDLDKFKEWYHLGNYEYDAFYFALGLMKEPNVPKEVELILDRDLAQIQKIEGSQELGRLLALHILLNGDQTNLARAPSKQLASAFQKAFMLDKSENRVQDIADALVDGSTRDFIGACLALYISPEDVGPINESDIPNVTGYNVTIDDMGIATCHLLGNPIGQEFEWVSSGDMYQYRYLGGSNTPSAASSTEPTQPPTMEPTKEPTVLPTIAPTKTPTTGPLSKMPTAPPTMEPTREPTILPTIVPTKVPTKTPTIEPTKTPTTLPTKAPSAPPPTASPTTQPTEPQTMAPTPADECQVDKIDVEAGSYSHDAQGYTFTAKITVTGKNLKKCEIQQLASVTESNKEWDGTDTLNNKILAGYEKGLRGGVNTGKFVVDTNWDWAMLKNDNKSELRDSQVHNVENRRVDINENTYSYEVQLNETERKFKIKIRLKSTKKVITTHDWSYKWDNNKAKLANKPYGRVDIAIGSFTKIVGIRRLERLNGN